jgi:hypothetical protein
MANPVFIIGLIIVIAAGVWMFTLMENSPNPDLIPLAWIIFFVISVPILFSMYAAG